MMDNNELIKQARDLGDKASTEKAESDRDTYKAALSQNWHEPQEGGKL